ncbi:hypothetical protein [Massilia sp. TS11]|uniref:hypothetical protein n=1 Tax=Massilia sp. TS11 TaxID=2908003 RepID=UPI001EDC8FF3|nr:hypothetical protein [Massilia sp. TS11]MCG2586472.1 hypothetical protein [Massilia sp. TS11]
MQADLRQLLILLAACAPLTPGMAEAAAASALAAATVLPQATPEAPVLVEVRNNGNGALVLSATPAAARTDGASVSATLSTAEGSTSLASVASASSTVPGLVGQRLAVVLAQADTNTPGKLQLTINYN